VKGEIIDQVMAVYMQAPASFTCEDVVEIHCHANAFIVREILKRFTDLGACFAEPGEFSYRAFMNGRIDLAEAEAIAELIDAGSESSAKIALQHLEGGISKMAENLHAQLFNMLTLVEAYLDFPEDEVDNIHINMLNTSTHEVLEQLERLISTFQSGKVMREGLSVLILGKPNVGKSSLLNHLLGKDRAIVTELPGTTRDFIEEHITLGHLPVKLIDTAGIRDSEDLVEQTGVRRALDKIHDADLILYVVDGTEVTQLQTDLDTLDFKEIPYILVVNKADKIKVSSLDLDRSFICVSAVTGYGMDELKYEIESKFAIPEGADNGVITEQRHFNIFSQIIKEVSLFKEGLDNHLPGEFLACHIRDAMSSLGRITGETVPEDILNHIFSKFCVGK
jgi:tRNA modification GTPase